MEPPTFRCLDRWHLRKPEIALPVAQMTLLAEFPASNAHPRGGNFLHSVEEEEEGGKRTHRLTLLAAGPWRAQQPRHLSTRSHFQSIHGWPFSALSSTVYTRARCDGHVGYRLQGTLCVTHWPLAAYMVVVASGEDERRRW